MKRLAVWVCCLAAGLGGCVTPKGKAAEIIPEGVSVLKLTQSAQDAFAAGNVEKATRYYQTIIDRFGDDPAARIAAEFEIAHLSVKRRDWDKALSLLDAILSQYEHDAAYTLPRAYQKLAELDRAKIPHPRKAKQ
jgi:outer membrane protein assembly factor BamD (BamD/ComL family)